MVEDVNKDLKDRYCKFVSKIPTFKDKQAKLGHWEDAIKSFNLYSVKNCSQKLDIIGKIVEGSEFGFRSFYKKYFTNFLFLKDFLLARIILIGEKISGTISNNRITKYEHARALEFIKKKGLLFEYLEFIKSFGIKSEMQTIRYFYYLKNLNDVLEKQQIKGKLNFLEIGAGAGGFSLFCFKKISVFRYVIVDLPEMLGYAAYQILKYRPDLSVVYPDEFNEGLFGKENKPTVYFLLPKQIEYLPENFFNVILNFTSFSEMAPEEIIRYFSYIYKIGKQGAIFYNVNRVKQLSKKEEDGVIINNPLLFPYGNNDEILSFGTDEFHYATRTGIGVIPTMTISRIARIKSNN
ncbi:MAG: hypothetical protein Athens071426_313 [Parcubacteria group bacterium Athens0714_26]|nr:MAG: hypothetical protein Athens101426_81 [Parcubacteria group bacterium Athens1014_26]TSD03017.1 MAG: hypothetical protein Athens071426_313 [Parcubacteria group bacterium Athens0714_26]